MNKKGITFFYTLMLGTIIIVLGLAFANPTKSIIDDNRDALNCSAPATDYDEAGCYGLEFNKILMIGGTILIGFAVIGAKAMGWL